ncbi:MAG: NUDIX domain-containing protein [Anaerolineaceae bacterium]
MDNPIYNRPNTFTVIPRVLAFIEKNDKVLMIERSKKNAFAYKKLNGIGGHIEKGEEPLTAVRREVKEESGLEITKFDLNVILFIDIETEKGVCVFVFSALYSGGSLQISDEGNLIWVKKNDLSNLNVVKDIPLIMELIEESKKDGKVKYLQHTYNDQELTITRID